MPYAIYVLDVKHPSYLAIDNSLGVLPSTIVDSRFTTLETTATGVWADLTMFVSQELAERQRLHGQDLFSDGTEKPITDPEVWQFDLKRAHEEFQDIMNTIQVRPVYIFTAEESKMLEQAKSLLDRHNTVLALLGNVKDPKARSTYLDTHRDLKQALRSRLLNTSLGNPKKANDTLKKAIDWMEAFHNLPL